MRIVFTRSGRIGSRIIRAVTGEDISHVGLVTSDELVIHATFGNVDIDSIEHFQATHEIVRTYKYTGAANMKALERIAILLEGKGYDFLALLGMGFRLLMLRSIGWAIPAFGHWATKGRYICTEFVDTIVGQRESNAQITPGQLEQRLLTSGQWTLVTNVKGINHG